MFVTDYAHRAVIASRATIAVVASTVGLTALGRSGVAGGATQTRYTSTMRPCAPVPETQPPLGSSGSLEPLAHALAGCLTPTGGSLEVRIDNLMLGSNKSAATEARLLTASPAWR
jgi:hypothetical protein